LEKFLGAVTRILQEPRGFADYVRACLDTSCYTDTPISRL